MKEKMHRIETGSILMATNNPISGLNKIFDNRVRLGVMSILMVNEEINFNDLKQMLEVTDGNLATHLQTLEESGFLKDVKYAESPECFVSALLYLKLN